MISNAVLYVCLLKNSILTSERFVSKCVTKISSHYNKISLCMVGLGFTTDYLYNGMYVINLWVCQWVCVGGGGGAVHCLFEGRYPLPNYTALAFWPSPAVSYL